MFEANVAVLSKTKKRRAIQLSIKMCKVLRKYNCSSPRINYQCTQIANILYLQGYCIDSVKSLKCSHIMAIVNFLKENKISIGEIYEWVEALHCLGKCLKKPSLVPSNKVLGINLYCPYCQNIAVLKDSSMIYQKNYGYIYICSQYPDCDAYVGCHPNTTRPLGTLANKVLRKLRRQAHAYFDPLWQRKYEILCNKDEVPKKRDIRTQGYAWLASVLNIPVSACHISCFDEMACKKVIAVCKPYVEKFAK